MRPAELRRDDVFEWAEKLDKNIEKAARIVGYFIAAEATKENTWEYRIKENHR